MKIYNIRKSKDFFETLSSCEGKVEIIKEDGMVVEFSGCKGSFQSSELSCFNGTIPMLELKFQNIEDLDRILNLIMNQRKTA